MRIVIAGTGNTASVLCALIDKSNNELVQVIGRSAENAQRLADQYHVPIGLLTDAVFIDADLYILALHDAALQNIERFPGLRNKMIVHTAGSVPMNVLKDCSSRYGVLYPLQTLSRYSEHIPEIPFLVDGSDQEIRHIILGVAKSLSGNVSECTDAERLNYHIAAVFAANFSNHMYALAEIFCQKERLEFKTLLPLINEVNSRVNEYSPFLTQTGPAIRNDVFTLNRHLQSLSAHPELKYIYLKMTESIMKIHGKR